MKKVAVVLISIFLFIGCSSSDEVVSNKVLKVNNSMQNLILNDQFGIQKSIGDDTKIVIFAFSKQVGHECNDFFATKEPSYLESKKGVFIADLSSAPSPIRSMFIIPGLKKYKHSVLLLEDKNLSNSYKPDGDLEKIVILSLEHYVIKKIEFLNDVKELDGFLDNLKD